MDRKNHQRTSLALFVTLLMTVFSLHSLASAAVPLVRDVEAQPLAANVVRLLDALKVLGSPLPEETHVALLRAARARDIKHLQELLDPEVLFVVSLNPEIRVKVQRGPGKATLQQGGFVPLLVKVINQSTVARQLEIMSPQAGPVYAGAALGILRRQAQTELNDNENIERDPNRFLSVEMFSSPPMTARLSGLEVEYAIALVYCHDPGKREATIGFSVGSGTQDLGFRGEVPILFDARPAVPVKLSILDSDGQPTTARLTFRDQFGKVYPPQAKRLAPDFFFQPQVYRHDGEVVLLPPGEFTMEYCRGPEYRSLNRQITIPQKEAALLDVPLQRWVDPMQFGFYCGDHHIHGAGCSHYSSPTEGVTPQDMFAQVKGEGLNVGCVLTWGPCYDFQRRFFSPAADIISEPDTILKYDLEISGFGSAALGHVCLLNLKDQTYPGSEGTKTKGWPTWTVPVLKWCKEQGGVTGYPHSALYINADLSATWMFQQLDQDADDELSATEAAVGLLPESFDRIDEDGNGKLIKNELSRSIDRAADRLPNLAIPGMDGAGAMEICVSTAEGVCDFISAMDTARIPEWNTWYHIMNSGFPLKLSGETDFPCMSSRRVGQGRVYVQLGNVAQVDFAAWCRGLAEGKSYVSDGFAHALEFTVAEKAPGFGDVRLAQAGQVKVRAKVAFAPEIPKAVAYGQEVPAAGLRKVGDTVTLHAPRTTEMVRGGQRLVEIVVGGKVVAEQQVPADGNSHDLEFDLNIEHSNWVALRHFPQLHTNPVAVIVAEKPIRCSQSSARWCAESIKHLWNNRHHLIAEAERDAAQAAYQRAIETYLQRAKEAPEGT